MRNFIKKPQAVGLSDSWLKRTSDPQHRTSVFRASNTRKPRKARALKATLSCDKIKFTLVHGQYPENEFTRGVVGPTSLHKKNGLIKISDRGIK